MGCENLSSKRSIRMAPCGGPLEHAKVTYNQPRYLWKRTDDGSKYLISGLVISEILVAVGTLRMFVIVMIVEGL